jgi:hypothetical protein
MSRSLAFLLAAATLIGCSAPPEKPILNQFFTASRLRDNTSLANFTTVAFEPNAQGVVLSYDITNVTPEERRPLDLRTLAKAHFDAETEDTEFSKRKYEYQTANLDAIKRVLKSERENTKLATKDAEVQATWSKLVEDGTAISKKVVDAKRRLAAEKALADMSINGGPTRVDVTKYDGELVSKDISISAPVRMPNGRSEQKSLVVTMQRAVLKADKEIAGRWIITAIRDGAGSPSTPRS